MGKSFCSIHVRLGASEPVLQVVRELSRSGTGFFVSKSVGGWFGVYPDGNDEAGSVSRVLAKRLQASLIRVCIHDDDVFFYSCYRDGKVSDEFCSQPDYLGNVSERVRRRYRGRPEALAELIGRPDARSDLRETLELMRSAPLFATDALARFASTLGLPDMETSYDALSQEGAGHVEGGNDFVHVPGVETGLVRLTGAYRDKRQERDDATRQLVAMYIHRGRGQTALSEAARWGHAPSVSELLDAGYDVNAVDESGRTALMAAASGGQTEIVRTLLRAGADPNAIHNGRTPILCCLGSAHSERVFLKVIEALLSAGADPALGIMEGKSAVEWARIRGSSKLEELLSGGRKK